MVYAKKFMAVVKRICLHHSGPPAGFNYTFEDINRYHRHKNWGTISNPWYQKTPTTLGQWGGYTLAINPEGEMFQYRAIGEETIGAKGYNHDTIHICLIGDFTKDLPTFMQKTKLKNLLVSFISKNTANLKVLPNTILDIKVRNIVPHRWLTPTTECNGLRLKDSFGQDLVREHLTTLQRLLISLLNRWRKMLQSRKLAGSRPECNLERG